MLKPGKLENKPPLARATRIKLRSICFRLIVGAAAKHIHATAQVGFFFFFLLLLFGFLGSGGSSGVVSTRVSTSSRASGSSSTATNATTGRDEFEHLAFLGQQVGKQHWPVGFDFVARGSNDVSESIRRDFGIAIEEDQGGVRHGQFIMLFLRQSHSSLSFAVKNKLNRSMRQPSRIDWFILQG
ncbi:hypothetical protein Ae201684_002237 [Aphanomyces euteiches]|uniref:Uncharacterized protein n=1 Tax=Aphanomyces euteiches TaxID=100861 RepID=A0A6G0XR83_9STRA|nr:hypothetical protein Ae201684_002237 [Aphanomyces euteiches]